jgi:hypothetical protein
MGLARYCDLLENRFDLAAGRAFEDAPLSAGPIRHNECDQHRVATRGADRRPCCDRRDEAATNELLKLEGAAPP